jgi:hypothetical protein
VTWTGPPLQQQSLRLRRHDRMGSTYCVEALAWIAASRHPSMSRALHVHSRTQHRYPLIVE